MPLVDPLPPNSPSVLAGPAGIFSVVRYHRDLTGDNRFEALPHIKVESIHFREGAVLPSARFSYVFDDTDHATPFPYKFEDVWPIGATGPYVVKPDEELLVYHHEPGAEHPIVVFDGFAQIPQIDMSEGLHATFVAVGVHARLWDQPIASPRYREAHDPETGAMVVTGLPTHFNPDDAPDGNCTPADYDEDAGDDNARPLFIDSQAEGVRKWTLPGMIRYLFWTGNPDEEFVTNPQAWTGQELDDYLESVIPVGVNGAFFDLSNPDTYETEPIIVRSFDASGKSLVEAAVEQLDAYGFKLFMNTRPDPADVLAPLNELIVFRVDGRDAVAPKSVYLPPHGSGFETHPIPDANGIHLARDRMASFNEVYVQTGQEEMEISVILAPDFEIAGADASNPTQFNASALANATGEMRKKYRVFIADEDGKGYYNRGTSAWVRGQPLDLNDVFGVDRWVPRRRPGVGTVHSTDSRQQPRRAELAFSRDYAGAAPAIWDRSGTWRSLGESGWRLLKDRLGIEIIAENPSAWRLPKAANDAQAAGDVVDVVTSLAANAGGNQPFFLRLTVVIQGDFDAEAVADRREASGSEFTVRRYIDAREYYKVQKIHESSAYNATGQTQTHRDDTERAVGHAAAIRLAHEGMAVAGRIAIPWVSHAYGVGDLIDGFSGRGVSFGEVGGMEGGEGPQYPAVVGFDWTCQLPQSTTLHLTDRRAEGYETDRGDGRMRK